MKTLRKDDGRDFDLMNWVVTFTGRVFCPLEPDPADVCIEDIAHHLSLKCRFGGASREFYSVAQHSVHCADHVAASGHPAAVQMAALLHDAGEAYLPDIVQPIKHRFFTGNSSPAQVYPIGFASSENRVMSAVIIALNVCIDIKHPAVKTADLVMLASEAKALMDLSKCPPWNLPPESDWAPGGALHRNWNVVPVPPAAAERLFLHRFKTLQAAMATQKRDDK